MWMPTHGLLLFSSVVLLVDKLLAALGEALHSLVQGFQETLQLPLSGQQTANAVRRVLRPQTHMYDEDSGCSRSNVLVNVT